MARLPPFSLAASFTLTLTFGLSPFLLPAAHAASASASASVAAPSAVFNASNPFYAPSTLPFQMPPFDRIQDADFAPAFDAGMQQQLAQVASIANNPAAPTFDNTIVAMERAGQLLTRVRQTFYNLAAANTNDTLDALKKAIAQKLAAQQDAILLNATLYRRVDLLYRQRTALGLDGESLRLLERYHTDFVRAGAGLSDANQAKLKAYNGQLASLMATFSLNVVKERNATPLVVDTRAELDGMAPAAIEAAAAAAKAKGLAGKYLVALSNTTTQAPLAVLTSRPVRDKLMALSLARGSRGGQFDNQAVALSIVKLRAERAALLGYQNFAAYALEDQTAQSTGAVDALLAELSRPAASNARREAAALQQQIDAAGGGHALGAADWAFYTDQLRKTRFQFDEKQLKPYLELNNVLTKGVFYAANRLYGVTFKERHDLPVYDPDVRLFDVFDSDGTPLGLFMADYYARANKQGGAWMNTYVSQSTLTGTHAVAAVHLNIPKPAAGQPTLLTFAEVTAMFHEFGHALHELFSNVAYPRFSGSTVPADYVEFPAQVNEMWAVWPDVLANYAINYQTGAAMPKDMLDKVIAAKKFNQGYTLTAYLAAAILDQSWHQLTPAQVPTDMLVFEASALHDAGVDLGPVPPRYRTTYFTHMFSSGYAAGYYGYLWSEKLDADAVDWFREHGGLRRANGDRFRQQLLSRGGTVDPMQLYRNFRGRDAAIGPLLQRRGLTAQ